MAGAPEGRSGWDVCLDQPGPGSLPGPGPGRRRSARLHRGVLGVVLLLIAATWIPSLFRDDPPAPEPRVAVVGTRLGAPVSLRLPAGATTTADDSYVGFTLPTGGVVMVTIPTQVVNPGGSRAPLPDDPASWLQQHPDVFVSRVATVTVGGRPARQVDYRRSQLAEPRSRFAALQLFCGWSDGQTASTRPALRPQACTGITPGARVRATFIPVGDRIVLVEMVWRTDGQRSWPMPDALRQAYVTLLKTLTISGRR